MLLLLLLLGRGGLLLQVAAKAERLHGQVGLLQAPEIVQGVQAALHISQLL
jgi:hypothetical protein